MFVKYERRVEKREEEKQNICQQFLYNFSKKYLYDKHKRKEQKTKENEKTCKIID